MENLTRLEQKIDLVLAAIKGRDLTKKILTAKDVSFLTGLDHRTVLNRSNLPASDRRYIPSVTFGSTRKYFEKKVIMRLFNLEHTHES
jgi:hypothetical protein